MDIFFHYIIGIIISKIVMGEYLVIAGITAMIPDLIGTIFYQIQKAKVSSKKDLKTFISDYIKYTKKSKFIGKLDKFMYRITHSLLTWILFSLVVFLFFRDLYVVLSLAYLSHIIVDIFTHEREFATRIFYPLSDFHMQGRNCDHKEVVISAWALLLILFFFSLSLVHVFY